MKSSMPNSHLTISFRGVQASLKRFQEALDDAEQVDFLQSLHRSAYALQQA